MEGKIFLTNQPTRVKNNLVLLVPISRSIFDLRMRLFHKLLDEGFTEGQHFRDLWEPTSEWVELKPPKSTSGLILPPHLRATL